FQRMQTLAPNLKMVVAQIGAAFHLFDVATGDLLAKFEGKGLGDDAVFSPDSRVLATCGNNRPDIILWDVERKQEMATLRGHSKGALALAFAPDGKRLARGGAAGTFRVWAVPPRAAKP